MALTAGRVGSGNEGQVDQGRGVTGAASYSKSQRKTGRVGSMNSAPNTITQTVVKSSDRRRV